MILTSNDGKTENETHVKWIWAAFDPLSSIHNMETWAFLFLMRFKCMENVEKQ